MELISVIVPVYKVEKYLEKCVKSIINQTYTNLEIILVDDGSPDVCGALCDEFAKNDSRIKVIHKANGGLSSARNTGLENATGKYIAFVDSDDFISEDYCEILYNMLIETNSDVSAVSYLRFKEDEADLKRNRSESETIIYENEDVVKEMLNRKTFQNIVWNKLYKKETIGESRFPVGVNYEDVYFSYEVLTKAKKISYKNIECYFYLKRASSISATCSEKNIKDFLYVVMHKFKGIKEKYPKLELYNYFAFLESILGISLLYAKSDAKYESIEEGLETAFEELKQYFVLHQKDLLEMLDDFQKSCIYMLNYNKELYFAVLKEFQKMKSLGKIK